MLRKILPVTFGLMLPAFAWADQSIYCPQNHGTITVGMSEQQVVAACGQPLVKQTSDQPLMKLVPMQQLYFNNQGAPTAFYGVWALPYGQSNYKTQPAFGGSAGGVQLEVNIVNNQVYAININGSSTNGFSVCGNRNIKVGDPVNVVYGACGTPSIVNKSFIKQPVLSKTKPQIWVYQPSQYQPAIRLTFVDGKLQSIN